MGREISEIQRAGETILPQIVGTADNRAVHLIQHPLLRGHFGFQLGQSALPFLLDMLPMPQYGGELEFELSHDSHNPFRSPEPFAHPIEESAGEQGGGYALLQPYRE